MSASPMSPHCPLALALLAALAAAGCVAEDDTLEATTIESLGRNVGGAAVRVTSLFSRKVPA